uniref:Uncharacterized protein n=1 Tax=Echinococcus granulosus TaxID=6210 RepID=A0A068WZB6_ECHGR|nr:hypothetical protein EgrG_002011100 [Echinococcus granulosus]
MVSLTESRATSAITEKMKKKERNSEEEQIQSVMSSAKVEIKKEGRREEEENGDKEGEEEEEDKITPGEAFYLATTSSQLAVIVTLCRSCHFSCLTHEYSVLVVT